MPSTCIFEFDRSEPIFHSGELMKVQINLTTTETKKFREIYVKFSGEAKVHWTKKGRHGNIHYRGHETYIGCHKSYHSDSELLPGTYRFFFDITLPNEAPSSCLESFGRISYEIALVIDRSFRFDNVFRRNITVLRKYDLNLAPELMFSRCKEDVKYIGFWPYKMGPFISSLKVTHGGYVPGQKLDYSLFINNQSSQYDLFGFNLRLVQIYTFSAKQPRREKRSHSITLVESGQRDMILRLTRRVFSGTLIIPPVPPTSRDNEAIILVKYHLEMSIKTGKFHRDSKIIIPIVIGTKPLVCTLPTQNNDEEPPSYNLLKPPSYEASTRLTDFYFESEEDRQRNCDNFLSKYSMYT